MAKNKVFIIVIFLLILLATVLITITATYVVIKFNSKLNHITYLAGLGSRTRYVSNYSSRHLSPIISTFNHRKINIEDLKDGYSFLIGGHLLSRPPLSFSNVLLNKDSAELITVPPATNITNNIELIKSFNANFFVGLGDLFFSNQQNQIQEFLKTFAYKIEIPFFNAPGNHDRWPDPQHYRDLFGKTYYHFNINNDYFIFLNTNRRGDGQGYPSGIDGEQLNYFNNLINKIKNVKSIKHVFIFTHQNVWLNHIGYNMPTTIIDKKERIFNFHDEIEIKLQSINKKFYWISGNPLIEGVGFIYHHNNSNIKYFNTTVMNRPEDTLILIKVKPAKEPIIMPISLTNKILQPIEHYNLSYLRKKMK